MADKLTDKINDMSMIKRVCVEEYDEYERCIEKIYRYFDFNIDSDDTFDYQYMNWLQEEIYDLKWNCIQGGIKVWLEDVDTRGCIKSNFRLV